MRRLGKILLILFVNMLILCLATARAAAVVGIPDGIRQAALWAVAYYTGKDFKPAKRVPARERTYWNGWGQKM